MGPTTYLCQLFFRAKLSLAQSQLLFQRPCGRIIHWRHRISVSNSSLEQSCHWRKENCSPETVWKSHVLELHEGLEVTTSPPVPEFFANCGLFIGTSQHGVNMGTLIATKLIENKLQVRGEPSTKVPAELDSSTSEIA